MSTLLFQVQVPMMLSSKYRAPYFTVVNRFLITVKNTMAIAGYSLGYWKKYHRDVIPVERSSVVRLLDHLFLDRVPVLWAVS